MKKISISIVTHNNERNILLALESVYKYAGNLDLSTFVVDNASSDKTVELVRENYPQVKIIKLPKNIGFGAGHNQVLNKINSDFHVILNPDITFSTNILDDLATYLQENPDVAIVTPNILNVDGSRQDLPKLNPKFKYLISGRLERFGGIFKAWRDQYTCKNIAFERPTEVDFCTGCFIMIRTSIFKKLNGFDEKFFMYFEDADLTRRAKKHGKTVLHPGICATHTWERTSAKSFKYLCIHVCSMLKYFRKWHKKERDSQ